jgi:hypothetical protein
MKRRIGVILVALGIFVIIMQPASSITGAVIDLSSGMGKLNFFIGIVLLIIGAVLIYIKK